MSQIATHFDVTRAAISGIIGRMKIRRGPLPKPPKPEKKVKPSTRVRKIMKKVGPAVPPLTTLHKTITVATNSVGVKLLRRKEGECAYLIGYHLCCGAPTTFRPGIYGPERTSWCKEHYSVVYEGKRRKENVRKQFKGCA